VAEQLVASSDLIRAYVNSTGDDGFARHAAAIHLATGKSFAPRDSPNRGAS
jgi:hypothetical protein